MRMGLVTRTAVFAGEMPLDKHAAALPHRRFFEHWIALVHVYPPVPHHSRAGWGAALAGEDPSDSASPYERNVGVIIIGIRNEEAIHRK